MVYPFQVLLDCKADKEFACFYVSREAPVVKPSTMYVHRLSDNFFNQEGINVAFLAH